MPHKTKIKIIEAALFLFGRDGICDVKLQHIADEVGISVGNLAYHYKHKEALIEAVYELAFAEIQEVLQLFLGASSLADFDEQLSAYYNFMIRFHFCNIRNRNIKQQQPELAIEWYRYSGKMLTQIRKRLQFYVQKNWLRPAAWPSCYEQLSNNIFLACCYWLPQQIAIESEATSLSFRQAIWSQIRPYFTPEGEALFTRSVGQLV